MTTRVVNLHSEKYDVYIGRPGRGHAGTFGNPIQSGDRCQMCGRFHTLASATLSCYRLWLVNRLIADVVFREQFLALKGKTLGCFCKPKACHGDVMRDLLEGDELSKIIGGANAVGTKKKSAAKVVVLPAKGSHWIRRRTGEEVTVEGVDTKKKLVSVCSVAMFILNDTPLKTFSQNYKPKGDPCPRNT